MNFLQNRDNSTPLFLSCGFYYPHRPFGEPDPSAQVDELLSFLPIPDSPEVRKDLAAYWRTLRWMDEAFGILWEELKTRSKTRPCLIVFTTDHGVAFPGMKCNLTDSGTGVALLIHAPDALPSLAHSSALVSHLDVFSTFCDYAGVPLPDWNQGHSLRPLLQGNCTSVRTEVFGEVSYHAAYEPKRSIRTKDFCYIRNFLPPARAPLANIDDGFSKRWMLQEGLLPTFPPEEELYDLHSDPMERTNVAGLPNFHGLIDALRQRLQAWMEKTRDPLLDGSIPAPSGAVVTPLDAVDP